MEITGPGLHLWTGLNPLVGIQQLAKSASASTQVESGPSAEVITNFTDSELTDKISGLSRLHSAFIAAMRSNEEIEFRGVLGEIV